MAPVFHTEKPFLPVGYSALKPTIQMVFIQIENNILFYYYYNFLFVSAARKTNVRPKSKSKTTNKINSNSVI